MSKIGGNLNLSHEIEKVKQRLPSQEHTLGRALKQPFCNTNSGSRKIMQGIQMEQCVQIMHPEPPIISTGYENQFGYLSSNFITADMDYEVIAKISKFSFKPNDHYWLILYNRAQNVLTMIERTPYYHITEFFGYLFNNDTLDSLLISDIVRQGQVLKKTISYDDFNNRAEGLNLTTMYIACEDVKEDPIVISESAATRFACPLIDKIEVMVNDNDILLNLYGEEKASEGQISDGRRGQYITFPDIGEQVKNNIFCAIRRELKDEEALFSQSWERLKDIMMNDKKFLCDDGVVIDINVYCNNIEKLQDSMYNNQIKKYYDETQRFAKEFVRKVGPYLYDENGDKREGLKVSYDLQKMFFRMQKINSNALYMQDKVFSNIMLEVYIQHSKPLRRGDKITDRYGGKGVISKVMPDNMMPHYLKDGRWHPVDVLYSMCTCINRLNDGQLFETSITYFGWQLVEYIKQNVTDYNVAFALIHRYIQMLNPLQADFLASQYQFNYGKADPMWVDHGPPDSDDNNYNRNVFIDQILHDGYIMLSMPPISSDMQIDKIRALYQEFPYIKKYCPISVPIKDSTGKFRMVYTRRPIVIGYKYIFRLKQLAEEKFSAVSLASTNIRNENSKSKLAKTHNARYPSTPVRVYGEMESSTMSSHIGPEIFIEEFSLNSSSPEARRLNKKLLIDDPFAFNVTLNEDCISQSADIVQAYLKVLGEKLCFSKLKKFKYHPNLIIPIIQHQVRKKKVVFEIPDEIRKTKDLNVEIPEEERKAVEEYVKEQHKIELEREKKPLKQVVDIHVGIEENRKKVEEYCNKLRAIGVDPKYVLGGKK